MGGRAAWEDVAESHRDLGSPGDARRSNEPTFERTDTPPLSRVGIAYPAQGSLAGSDPRGWGRGAQTRTAPNP